MLRAATANPEPLIIGIANVGSSNESMIPLAIAADRKNLIMMVPCCRSRTDDEQASIA
jgi:hypothetical protein